MKRVILISFLSLLSMIQISYSQMSGLWTVSDTTYAEYGVEDKREPCIASSGEESVVLLANTNLNLPHYLKRSTDKGKSWESIFTPPATYRLFSVANPTKNVIVITGDTIVKQGSNGGFWIYKSYGFITVSEDGGKTWNSQVLDSNCIILCLSMYDSQNGIAVKRSVGNMYNTLQNKYDTLLVTNDCWKSFRKVILPDNIVLSRMSFCFSDKIFFINNYNTTDKRYNLYKTFDGGLNWKMNEFPSNVLSVTFYNEDIGWACGAESLGSNNRKPVIYKTENGFADYQTSYPTTDEYFQNSKYLIDISFSDSLNGIAVGSFCIILRTSDGGNTWRQEDLPYIFGYSLRYNSFLIAKSVNQNFALTIGDAHEILKYEGEEILAAPRLKKVPSPVNIYNVPIEWNVVLGADKYHLQLAIENSQYYNSVCYDTAMVLDTIIYAPIIDTVTTMMKILYPEAKYNSSYYARVKAINSNSESQWGEVVYIFWTPNDGSKISAPKFITPQNQSNVKENNIVLTWTNSGAGMTYDLQIDSAGNFINSQFDEMDLKGTSFDVSNKLRPGKTYRARVRVHPDQKFSDWTYIIFMVTSTTDIKQDIIFGDILTIFPNPTHDFITIQFQTSEVYIVQIFDVLGIEVMSESIHPMTGSHRMNVENLPAGVYFIRFGNQVEKFVKM